MKYIKSFNKITEGVEGGDVSEGNKPNPYPPADNSFGIYGQEEWWKNDPDKLMSHIYWLKRQLPPVDPRKKKREWLKIMDQLAAKHKAPYKDFSRLAKYVFESAEESKLNEGKSINAIQKEWAKVTSEMKTLAQKFKGSEGDEKTKILSKLKELTKKKKQLEADLDDAVMSKGINQELSSVDENKNLLNYDNLSSTDYQKVKKYKEFNPDDWEWDSDEDVYKKVNT